MRSRLLVLLGASLLLGAASSARGQEDSWRSPGTRPASDQSEAAPATDPQSPQKASSDVPGSTVVLGTVVSLQPGRTLKVRETDGKIKAFTIKDAAVDSSIKVGDSVRITESKDANGVRSLTVESTQPPAR